MVAPVPVPQSCCRWVLKDLTSWVFRLRKGVLFHNGRDVDAEAVKLNVMRIKAPAIGGDWERGAVENIDSVDVLDRYMLRLNARVSDASMPTSVMHYPTRLMAPDAFFRRNLHSKSQYAKVLSGWENAKYDQLVEEAKRTLDQARRKALYVEAWNLVNTALPHFYLHEEVYTSAAVKGLRGYQPGMMGALHYRGGGLRTAHMEAS